VRTVGTDIKHRAGSNPVLATFFKKNIMIREVIDLILLFILTFWVGFFIGQNVLITRINKIIEDMKPQMNPSGKGKWASFWGDKVKKNIKRIFSKSDRQKCKLDIQKDL
jgi:hypothetical protein